jgi:hypothetical protein
MDALHLADHLYKKLRQRREDIQVSLGTGNIGSFDEYRFMEDEIRLAMKAIEYADD